MNATVIRYFVPDSMQNYNHLVVCGDKAAIVDPFNWHLAQELAGQHGLTIDEIWLTHGHGDHIRGVPGDFPGPVRGHPSISGCAVSHPLDDDDTFEFNGIRVEVITTPGHTFDHLCFYLPDIPALIAGDTLFNAGVGNTRSGDTGRLYRSIMKLSRLPDETLLYNGHDYLRTNLGFSASIVGAEPELNSWRERAEATSHDDRPITRLADERRINLFLRLDDPAVRNALAGNGTAELPGPEAVFHELRSRRDQW